MLRRIARVRIIPFLLELIVRSFTKRRYRVAELRIIGEILVLFKRIYTQIWKGTSQNHEGAYNSVPFRIDYTQILEKVLQNPIFAYKVEDVSVPTSHFIRNPVEMCFRIAGLRIIRFF